MPWLRIGDNAATYHALMNIAVMPDADDRLLNEVFGWLVRCASSSAGQLTDYVVEAGIAINLAGGRQRYNALLAAAASVGLVEVLSDEAVPAYRIHQDPDFIHMRTEAAVKQERQRQQDRRTPELTSRVRARDGDSCRYCGVVVNWHDRVGARRGTYDHGVPGEPATLETYFVCCGSCNESMGNGPRFPRLPAPARPYYTSETLQRLEKHGLKPAAGTYVTEPPPRPMRPTSSITTDQPDSDLGATWRETQVPPGHEGDLWTGRDGTGRDGPVRVGAGQAGTGRDGSRPAPGGPRRSRRGRRGSRGGNR